MSTAYLAFDLHANTTTFGWMDAEGTYRDEDTFDTSASRMISCVAEVPANELVCTFEEGPLAGWAARALHEHVDELIVCDPRENDSISDAIHKADGPDTYELCRLLRLDGLNEVYHPEEDQRAVFKAAARHYLDLRDRVRVAKQKITAAFQRWGVFKIEGVDRYTQSGRKRYLDALSKPKIRAQQKRLYRVLDAFSEAKAEARRDLLQQGQKYPEIEEFQKVPGMGPIRSHVFDAFIQTPHRFPNKSKIWRYCRLGVKKQSTAGQSTGPEHLDVRGVGELKNVSYQAWNTAVNRQKGPNEVKTFYERSCERSRNPTNARLNTQRKIIATLWGLWKRGSSYDPELFLSGDTG